VKIKHELAVHSITRTLSAGAGLWAARRLPAATFAPSKTELVCTAEESGFY